MGRETNCPTKGRGQHRSRIELLLATITLFWSAQLLGREDTLGPSQPGVRQEASPQHVLVVNIADRKLVVMQGDHVLKTYTVAVGKPSTPSPTGQMRIINKVVDPTYYHQGKVIPPGKSNPLGDRWMGLNEKGYGIHGTNVPSSIGKAASHGCIRMGKRDVEELFNLVRVGDVVEVRDEHDAEGRGVCGPGAQPCGDGGTLAATAGASERPAPSRAFAAVMAVMAGD
jgi:L,D-transpeptidase catalytic domain